MALLDVGELMSLDTLIGQLETRADQVQGLLNGKAAADPANRHLTAFANLAQAHAALKKTVLSLQAVKLSNDDDYAPRGAPSLG